MEKYFQIRGEELLQANGGMVGSHAAAPGKSCTAGKKTGVVKLTKLMGGEFRMVVPAAGADAGDAIGCEPLLQLKEGAALLIGGNMGEYTGTDDQVEV